MWRFFHETLKGLDLDGLRHENTFAFGNG